MLKSTWCAIRGPFGVRLQVWLRYAIWGIVVVGLVASPGCRNAQSDGEIPAAIDEERIQVLQRLNIETANHWQKMGSGFQLKNVNVHFDAFLQSAEGSCSQESYLFARQVLQKGLKARRLGLWNSNGANDVMVEVGIDSQWFLFVPSTGVFYPFGFHQLMSDTSQADQYIGEPLHGGEIFLREAFFSGLRKIDVYHNLNNAEHSFVKTAELLSKNLSAAPNDAAAAADQNRRTYAAGRANAFPQTLEYRWAAPVSFYRLWLHWYSAKDYANDYQVLVDEGEGYLELAHIMGSRGRFADGTELGFPRRDIVGLKIVVARTHGQNRLLLRDVGVY